VAGPKFSFDMLDADGDGRITRSEYEAAFKVCIQEQLYHTAACALYVCVCVCVCVCVYIYVYIYIYIYIYIYMHACMHAYIHKILKYAFFYRRFWIPTWIARSILYIRINGLISIYVLTD